jgi:hypothetical protein
VRQKKRWKVFMFCSSGRPTILGPRRNRKNTQFCVWPVEQILRNLFSGRKFSIRYSDNGRTEDEQQPRKHSGLKALLHQLLGIDVHRHDNFLREC